MLSGKVKEMEICLAQTDQDIRSCFLVMIQLRPHLQEAEFLERIRRQEQAGYRVVLLEDDGAVRAVSGFRLGESLAWGKYLYIDDLVTDEAGRSHGYGQHLFDWLLDFARAQRCEQVHLDSGVQRFGAHRFYLRNRMDISSHHFTLSLK
ncbi:MAG: GNAT family N-acetyltransferase [Candidatus Binatia bacterium]